MTLIALLLLFPTPLPHPWGPDDTIPGDHVLTRAVAPVVRDQGLVIFSGDRARGAECADGERGDGDGAKPFLDWPGLSHPCCQDDLPSHPRSLPGTSSPSVRSRHLRC
jgi:hypothetical protein